MYLDLKITKKMMFLLCGILSLLAGAVKSFNYFKDGTPLIIVFFFGFAFLLYVIIETATMIGNDSIIIDTRSIEKKEHDDFVKKQELINVARQQLLFQAMHEGVSFNVVEKKLETLDLIEDKLLNRPLLLNQGRDEMV